jgi:peptide/nickel transport system substrate-binding protein
VRIRRFGAGLAAAGFALLSAPIVTGVGTPAAYADTPKVLRVAVTTTIASLNPFLAYHAADTEIGRLMYSFLTAYDQSDQHPIGGVADSWKVAEDKLTWTFHVRDGMKWSDRQPITAKDVAFTFTLMMTNTTAASANGNFVRNFDTVTAPDDHNVVIKTKRPQSTMLALDVPIVPEHVWSKVSDIGRFTNLDFPAVGSGPFILTDYKQDQYVKLKANPDFSLGRPAIDELRFIHYDNSEAAVQGLLKGDVDVVGKLTSTQFNGLRGKPNIALNKAQGHRINDLLINPGAQTNTHQAIGDGNPALSDVKLRQAIARAIDPKTLVDKVFGGYAEVGSGFIPPVFSTYHWDPSATQVRKFDPAAATRTLDEAGYTKGPDGIRLDKTGKPLKLRLIGDSGQTTDQPATQYIKSWLKDIGIDVDVQMFDSDKFSDAGTGGHYDLAMGGWGANPDPDAVLSIETCGVLPDAQGNGNTQNFLCDQDYDTLYAEQQAELDPGKRAELVKQMQARLYELATSNVFAYGSQLEAFRSDRFAGFGLQPEPNGVITQQNGYWGYYYAKPVVVAQATGGGTTGLIIGIVVVAVVVLAGGLVLARRRKTGADERE